MRIPGLVEGPQVLRVGNGIEGILEPGIPINCDCVCPPLFIVFVTKGMLLSKCILAQKLTMCVAIKTNITVPKTAMFFEEKLLFFEESVIA